MILPEFTQRLQSCLPAGVALANPGGGTTTVLWCDGSRLCYRRGKSRFYVDVDDLYRAYQQFAGRDATTADLKTWAPAVFDSARGGHNCNCTVLLLALHAMGLAGRVFGTGRRGAPFGASISLHDGRWALYLDVQGFSERWSRDHVGAVGELMVAIARIGRRVFPDEGDRLFAHQFGDGFLIVSDFHETSLERCVAIAIALMRHLAGVGRFARCSIAEGEIADVMGCYPKEVFAGSPRSDCVPIGAGILTLVPVLGGALIAAAEVDRRKPRGPLLLTDETKAGRLKDVPYTHVPDSRALSIDWVHADLAAVRKIQEEADLRSPVPQTIEASLREYCRNEHVSEEWRQNVESLLHV